MQLERKNQPDETPTFEGHGVTAVVTPPIDEDYWLYRVRLSDAQAIVGFPKFGTVGVGFAVEDDWNTNLPVSSPAEKILAHIRRNKGDDAIADEDVLAAIRLVQAAAEEDERKARA